MAVSELKYLLEVKNYFSEYLHMFIIVIWRRKWQLTPVFLSGKSHGQRSLAGCSSRSHKELDMTEQA